MLAQTFQSAREKEELLRKAIRRYLTGEIDRKMLDRAQEKYRPDHRGLVDSQVERRSADTSRGNTAKRP